jgi:hypothetical protein
MADQDHVLSNFFLAMLLNDIGEKMHKAFSRIRVPRARGESRKPASWKINRKTVCAIRERGQECMKLSYGTPKPMNEDQQWDWGRISRQFVALWMFPIEGSN